MNKLERLIEAHKIPFSRYLAQARAAEAEAGGKPFVGAERITLAIDSPDSWVLIAGCLASLGLFDKATSAYKTALKYDSTSTHALQGLVNLGHRFSLNSKEARMLRRMASDSTQPIRRQAAASFTLGQLYDSQGKHDLAFEYFSLANNVTQQLNPPDQDMRHFSDEIDQTISLWTPAAIAERQGWGNPTDTPVFVVGMPRSGTTLVEQIIASHPACFAAGERQDICKLVRQRGSSPENWDQTSVRLAAMGQLSKMKLVGGPALRIVDKMPDNVFWLGIIHTLFPRAKIILCRRDVRDVCLSCFCQSFGSGLSWTCDLTKIAQRISETERIAAHWLKVLPSSILEVHYENLVGNLEVESRRLIDFIELEWTPECVEFYKTDRQVLTASVWQVRQPLFNTAVGKWQKYKSHLVPAFDQLSSKLQISS